MSINTDYLDSDDYKTIVNCLEYNKEIYEKNLKDLTEIRRCRGTWNGYGSEINYISGQIKKIDRLIKIFTQECHS